jgi:PAS domain-containing protein
MVDKEGAAIMKTLCAWCGSDINSSAAAGHSDVNAVYAVCMSCANTLKKNMSVKLRDFLDELNIPVVLVDSGGVVQAANRMVCRMLGKDQLQMEGFFGGEVFECIYAKLPEGCGNSIHCSGCAIRRAVMETFSTGKGVTGYPATLKQQTPAGVQELSLSISTEMFTDYVMLRINELNKLNSET